MTTLPATQEKGIDTYLLEVTLATANVLNLDKGIPLDVDKGFRALGAEGSDKLLILKELGQNPGEYVQGEKLTQYAEDLVREIAALHAPSTPERAHLMEIAEARGHGLLRIITPRDIAEIIRHKEEHR